ncbi:hypothetical protein HW555_013700 [Spodoptera exigua]|uniref:PiggyBac transposable element-derived protein domain-containing protein n=1 Tax=Spodoptera exigua TaxID=7107 RepID=A0A835G471_SPOEX|nr:hypothetical protein HW555_013700 [Spodoptera exigua]
MLVLKMKMVILTANSPVSSPIISSDPPSLDSSYENVNILNSDEDDNVTANVINNENVRSTPTFEEVFPSPSTNNYEAIPTLNSIQSLPTPSVPSLHSPAPATPITRRKHITQNTNLYSVQKTGKSIQVTEDDIKSFLAIEVVMGIVKMPAYTDYWAKRTRYAPVADIMSLKRYEQIRRHIHFVDNIHDDSSDRYFKIRPVMEKVRQNFLKLEEEGQYSIDEMMIPYKGRKAGSSKQYIQNKPKKWGFKNFVSAGVSGLIYDFVMYGGENTFRGYTFSDTEFGLGFGAQIAIALCQTIKKSPAVYMRTITSHRQN